MRTNIFLFLILIESFEKKKQKILKTAKEKGCKSKRKTWVIAIFLALLLEIELVFFCLVKKAITLNTYFQIFVKTRPFFINFNILVYGIGVEVYYIEDSDLAGIMDIIDCLIIYLLRKVI